MISSETFGALVLALGVSKWVTGRLNVPPTLRRLVSDSAYVQRIVAGEFAAAATDAWRCAQCATTHPPLEDCPTKCRGCGGYHPGLIRCGKLWDLERREQRLREAEAREARS